MKRKIDWLTVLLLLPPIFFFTPILVSGLFQEFVGSTFDRRGTRILPYTTLGLLLSGASPLFVTHYWVKAKTAQEKIIRGLIVALAISPLVYLVGQILLKANS